MKYAWEAGESRTTLRPFGAITTRRPTAATIPVAWPRRAGPPCDTIGSMGDRYITASELKSFDFCRRAWFLERQGTESTLVSERARGQADHESHGNVVQQANLGRRAATLLFVLGLAGIAAAALVWWFAR